MGGEDDSEGRLRGRRRRDQSAVYDEYAMLDSGKPLIIGEG
jgi:hypothetical protein